MYYKHATTGEIRQDPQLPNITNASHEMRLAAGWEVYPDEMVQADAEAAAAARFAALVTEHRSTVKILTDCIAQFGLTLPIEFDDAVAVMYAALETQPELTRHAMLAQSIYLSLHEAGLSDHDIYLISEEPL